MGIFHDGCFCGPTTQTDRVYCFTIIWPQSYQPPKKKRRRGHGQSKHFQQSQLPSQQQQQQQQQQPLGVDNNGGFDYLSDGEFSGDELGYDSGAELAGSGCGAGGGCGVVGGCGGGDGAESFPDEQDDEGENGSKFSDNASVALALTEAARWRGGAALALAVGPQLARKAASHAALVRARSLAQSAPAGLDSLMFAGGGGKKLASSSAPTSQQSATPTPTASKASRQHDQKLRAGAMVAGAAAGGAVVGALTLGLGLIPYMAIVGGAAAVGGGTVASYHKSTPTDHRLLISCRSIEEARKWKVLISRHMCVLVRSFCHQNPRR
jgi:hypothetical protein